ncbi:MAG TPA: hypothetical protein VGZ28_04920 [Terriglobales bacterium]|jgi:hypothetical protein|nr:hypothetical protein [Terriglobales bacterium]
MLIGILIGALLACGLLWLAQILFQDAVSRPGPVFNVATWFLTGLARCVGTAGYFCGNKLLKGHLLSAILFSLTFSLYAIVGCLHYAPRWLQVPTLTYVLLLITLACWTLSGITFAADRWRIPIVLLLGIWLLITAQLPNTDHFYRTKTPDDPRSEGCFPDTPNPAEVLLASKSPKSFWWLPREAAFRPRHGRHAC